MNNQYRVVPEALRKAQQAIDHTAERWSTLANRDLPGWTMNPGDLGLIGRMSGIVTEYNTAAQEILEKTKKGKSSLDETADLLHEVARDYEQKDAEYYEKFGWIQRDLGEPAPPPK